MWFSTFFYLNKPTFLLSHQKRKKYLNCICATRVDKLCFVRPLSRFVSYYLKHMTTQYLITNLNLLEGTVNHGNEHVEQHYHHGNVVNPIQHVTNVLDEFMSIVDDNRPDLGESKYSPEQCLEALLQAGQMHRERNRRGREESYF